MNLSILIGTHGTDHWKDLALSRAAPSALSQDAEIIIRHHAEGNRSSSRNAAAMKASGDWLCFLDADDELSSGYVQHMKRAAEPGRLLTPRVQRVVKGRAGSPFFYPEKPIHAGNWLIIGTLIERDLFWEIGGWNEFDPKDWNEWDDWDLWIRAQQAGAVPKKVPGAIYIAHSEPTSRHRNVDRAQVLKWHLEIQDRYWPDGIPA